MKLLTGIFSEAMYGHLSCQDLLPNEQKGCRKNSRGTKDQLIIYKAILKNSRRRFIHLSMAWIDYREAYDIDLGMFKNGWSGPEYNHLDREQYGKLEDSVDIFQGDSLSQLLFVMIMIPLSLILRDTRAGYKLKKQGRKINHLLFMSMT